MKRQGLHRWHWPCGSGWRLCLCEGAFPCPRPPPCTRTCGWVSHSPASDWGSPLPEMRCQSPRSVWSRKVLHSGPYHSPVPELEREGDERAMLYIRSRWLKATASNNTAVNCGEGNLGGDLFWVRHWKQMSVLNHLYAFLRQLCSH